MLGLSTLNIGSLIDKLKNKRKWFYMFSSLKRMVEKKRFSSIVFFAGNVEIKMGRMEDNYNITFQSKEGFEEYNVTKEEFLKYLKNIMQKLVFKRSAWRITKIIKMSTVCSFRIEKERK